MPPDPAASIPPLFDASSVDAVAVREKEPWRRELAAAIRDPEELCRLLGLEAAVAEGARQAAGGFPLLVPRGFAARMKPGDPSDPLLLQVLPRPAERNVVPGWGHDPLEEAGAIMAPGLVKKYDGRALLLVTGACAVNCRYCFRREFPYDEHGAGAAALDAGIAAIAADPTVREVILSGGDPLVLDDDRLGSLLERIVAIPSVRRVRLHTRLPVVLPSRVTPRLVAILAGLPRPAVVVLHVNHAAELAPDVAVAIGALASSRAMLLNQAVLLAAVNDSVPVLAALSERLVDVGVLPYYLHLPDRVAGTSHFDVAETVAVGLLASLREILPGYAVPRLVREIPGQPSKVWIG
jgi:EF-P beta-lysylation protein EpmB